MPRSSSPPARPKLTTVERMDIPCINDRGNEPMSLAKKLQIKGGQKARLVNAPKGFSLDVSTTKAASADVVLVFAKNKAELDKRAAPAIDAARNDRLSWIAHPKAGQLHTDLNRDILWKLLEKKGVRPVRQVALDEVWSAPRFRPASEDKPPAREKR